MKKFLSLVTLGAAEFSEARKAAIAQVELNLQAVDSAIRKLEEINRVVQPDDQTCKDDMKLAHAFKKRALLDKAKLEQRFNKDPIPETLPTFECITSWSSALDEMLHSPRPLARDPVAEQAERAVVDCGVNHCPIELQIYQCRRAVEAAHVKVKLAKGLNAYQRAVEELQTAKKALLVAENLLDQNNFESFKLVKRYIAIIGARYASKTTLLHFVVKLIEGKESVFLSLKEASDWFERYEGLHEDVVPYELIPHNPSKISAKHINVSALAVLEEHMKQLNSLLPLSPELQVLVLDLWETSAATFDSSLEGVRGIIERATELQQVWSLINSTPYARPGLDLFSDSLRHLGEVINTPYNRLGPDSLKQAIVMLAKATPAVSVAYWKERLAQIAEDHKEVASKIQSLRRKYKV